jgi:hypothetical protein
MVVLAHLPLTAALVALWAQEQAAAAALAETAAITTVTGGPPVAAALVDTVVLAALVLLHPIMAALGRLVLEAALAAAALATAFSAALAAAALVFMERVIAATAVTKGKVVHQVLTKQTGSLAHKALVAAAQVILTMREALQVVCPVAAAVAGILQQIMAERMKVEMVEMAHCGSFIPFPAQLDRSHQQM